MRDRLGDELAAADAAQFVGRSAELAAVTRFLDSPSRVLLISGEGGIGKSTLLRAIRRSAVADGRSLVDLDARMFQGDAGAIDGLICPWRDTKDLLVLIDSAEHLGGLVHHLRSSMLQRLSATSKVVIAGRGHPDPSWSRDGWAAVTDRMALSPMPPTDAEELAVRLGVAHASRCALVSWAAGLPLALVVGAELDADVLAAPLDSDGFDRAVGHALVRHLIDGEVTGTADVPYQESLSAAAIAPVIDRRILAAMLPHLDADAAVAWLVSGSFVDAVAPGRYAVHDRLRSAIRTELGISDPARSARLRKRLVDHLVDRALGGEPELVTELGSLIEDPRVRWGVGSQPVSNVWADSVRQGDAAFIREQVGATDAEWWQRVERWFVEAPDNVVVFRGGGDPDRPLIGAGLWATPNRLPAFACEDPLLAAIVADLAVRTITCDVVLLLDIFDLSNNSELAVSPVVSAGNAAVLSRSGVANPRWVYGTVRSGDDRTAAFLDALGSVRRPDLDLADPSRTREVHAVDYGAAGLIGITRDLRYRDLGLEPPAQPDRESVRFALRHARDPVALAKSPLARGATVELRAESVRSLLSASLDAAFGDGDRERLSRATIQLGYLEADSGHVAAQRSLHLSRTAYFARLAAAADRVALVVLDLWAGR